MAHVTIQNDAVSLDDPVLVEGLPGVGLVGKIAADHLVDAFEMTYYASIDECEGLPNIALYADGDYDVQPPVRVYADESRDLLVLQSDIPISQSAADHFSSCLTNWLDTEGILPIYLSGLPTDDKATPPRMFGVATGDATHHLESAEIGHPTERGLVSGPTGALLARAGEADMDAVGLVVQSDRQFPDPEAARIILKDGINPIADIDVPLQELVDQAGEIRAAKEQFAERMRQASEEESTQAQPLRMYQ